MIPVQIFGLTIAIFMIYYTYLNYKRKNFSKLDLIFWSLIWGALSYASLFPESLNIVLETLGVARAMDLFTIVGVVISFILIFYLYVTSSKNKKKLESLVEKLALKK